MAVNTKIIQRRIKSVKNTRKITKAMEMVAAAKMRRAVEAALNTRTYASLAWDLLVNLSKSQKKVLPLLETRPVKKLLVILVTSNRGLCGSFNSNILKKIAKELADPKNISRHRLLDSIIEPSENIEIDVLGVGKKGVSFAKKNDYDLIASFTELSDTPKLDDVLPITKMVIDDFIEKKYDKVVVAYTDYQSAISQVAKLRQVLPVSEFDLEKMLEEAGEDDDFDIKSDLDISDYVFEPSKEEVLDIILPRLVETQIYQALLESSASEHSARMLAMRNASDAAGDMIEDLTLTFNKARQAGITQEIAEIASGAAALE
ncbi:MAG: ATP synthase F1 subunit gamma [Candidatus Magasanikbacteria bacterium]|nr:ATP synthase F1 subunit gamma [Candidatus Magasanikbacteria bacterium]